MKHVKTALWPVILTGIGTAIAEPPTYEQTFDDPESIEALRFTDPAAWKLDAGSLWQFAASNYAPAQRSPHNIALLPVWIEGDFVIDVDLMQTGREYAHRDLCVFFGVRSPSEFLYAHLSTGADPNAHHIQVVNNAPRTPITTTRSEGVDWGRDVWRHVRIECDASTESVRVFFDDAEVLAAAELPWSGGFIGFGSFDDEGRIDNIRVTAASIEERTPDLWSGRASIVDQVAGQLITLDDDGAWCWFQDERCIVHDGMLIVGTVSGGAHEPDRRGDINVIVHDLDSGATRLVELHDQLQRDDHNNPGLIALPDGRLLAIYTKHGSDRLIRMRSTSGAGDLVRWEEERTFEPAMTAGHGVTYSNIYQLSAENDGRGRLYDFFRGEGWDPNALISDDAGQTWHALGQVIDGPGRPYARYASNGRDAIHFVCTDQHPRNFDNSLYHGFIRGGVIHASDGTPISALGEQPARHEQLTPIFRGDADNVAWCSNIELDEAGHPCVVYSVQKNSAGLPVGQGGEDCRYRYARWDGERWHDHPLGYAGQRLYPREDDYTGLLCIDPADANTVYLSTNADPTSGAPLISLADGRRHYEIFQARTTNGGRTWVFSAVTRNSSADNLRPMMPENASRPMLVWLRGRYTTMHDFDQSVVALPIADPLPPLTGAMIAD